MDDAFVETAEYCSPSSESENVPRRKPRIRARTISVKRLSKRELERGRRSNPTPDIERPVTRADCLQGENAQRPCPFITCKHHLYLDVSERSGAIKLNFPDKEVWDLPETCTLDIADRGGVTLEETGAIMNLTRERIRQLEMRGLHKIRASKEGRILNDEYTDEPLTTRKVIVANPIKEDRGNWREE